MIVLKSQGSFNCMSDKSLVTEHNDKSTQLLDRSRTSPLGVDVDRHRKMDNFNATNAVFEQTIRIHFIPLNKKEREKKTNE